MNGEVKWHKASGPAFNPGEEWESVDGYILCRIVSVEKFGDGQWDYRVTYEFPATGTQATKDAWSFQVRYRHIADARLKKKLL